MGAPAHRSPFGPTALPPDPHDHPTKKSDKPTWFVPRAPHLEAILGLRGRELLHGLAALDAGQCRPDAPLRGQPQVGAILVLRNPPGAARRLARPIRSKREVVMRKIPPDAPEADALEQARDWSDEEDIETPEIPGDAPEADVLDQQRPSPLDEEDWERR
jgi:hypothetical protein